MKAIIKRNLKNYLKNPIFWIGLIVVLISMYQTLAPYLSIHYVKSDETFRKVKMASDGDVMEGCIPATPDKERELWEKEIVKILQDTENGFGMSEVEAEAVISEMKETIMTKENKFTGCTIVATGKLEHFTRDGINDKILELGAKPGSSVTKKTDYLICGEKAGSKLAKAQSLGIPILTEAEFLEMIA